MINNKDQWLSALEVFDQNVFGILKLNLTTDEYEIIKNRKPYGDIKSLGELFHSFADRGIIHPQDTRAYNDHVDMEYLRQYFKSKEDVWRLRCRCKAGEGFSWVMMEMRPSKNFTLNNMELYMFLQDVDNEIFDRHIQQVMMRQKIVEERLMMQMANEVLDSGNWHIFYKEDGSVEQVVYDEKISSLYGYNSPEEMVTCAGSWISLIHPDDREMVEQKIQETLRRDPALEQKKMFKQEFRAQTKNQGYRWFLSLGEVHARDNGNPYLFFGIMIDITRRKEYDAALEKEIKTNERLQETLIKEKQEREIIDSIASIYNTIHVIDLENKQYAEIVAMNMVHNFFEEYKDKMEMQQLFDSVMKLASRADYLNNVLDFINLSTLQERLRGKSMITEEFMGVVHGWLQAGFIPVKCKEDGTPVVVLFTTLIIDEQKRREENLIRISNTDELTRLYNRRAYENDISDREFRGVSENFGFVSIDVTGLKRINDSLGHAAGDELLQGAAQCLVRVFGNKGKVYRTGGDEFIVMLDVLEEEMKSLLDELDNVTKEYRGQFIKEIVLAKGVAFSKEFPDASILELEKVADQRMYQDKSNYYITHGIERRR